LIGNAVKFTDRGNVRVTARRVHEPEIQAAGRLTGGSLLSEPVGAQTSPTTVLRIDISDTGIGIPEDGLNRLFQAFSQLDGSSSRRYGGTGLGLAICRQLVEMMGGVIGVWSAPDQGSTFWFTIRLGEVAGAPAEPSPPAILRDQQLLIVDGHAATHTLLADLSAGAKMTAHTSTNLTEGITWLRAARRTGQRASLVLVDQAALAEAQPEEITMLTAALSLHDARAILLGRRGQRPVWNGLPTAQMGGWVGRPIRRQELYATCEAALSRTERPGPGRPGPGRPGSAPDGMPPRTLIPAETLMNGRSILVAEDNPVNQKVLVRLLRQRGYHVEAVTTGQLAVEAVARQRYDAVLMDCQMPGMDGFEATEIIRRDEAVLQLARQTTSAHPLAHTPAELPALIPALLPIIAVTASATSQDRDRCLAAGMDDYLSKPIDVAALDHILQRWLGATQLVAE
jgi:two-component system sensor histidine kinase/response regulator